MALPSRWRSAAPSACAAGGKPVARPRKKSRDVATARACRHAATQHETV